MKFKKGNRWKNNRSLELQYRRWRKNVFELNKRKVGLSKYFICMKCGKKRKTTKVLHAHHIFSWNKFESKRYDMKNGVVLCRPCHSNFHRKYKFEALEKPSLLIEWLGTKNKDIIEYVSKHNSLRPKIVIGFAAETNNLNENSKKKLIEKSCDWIIANDVSDVSIGFESDFNEVSIFYNNNNVI